MKKIVSKKLDLTEDSKAKFFAETIGRHFTEEVMSFPKEEKKTDPKLPTTIDLTEQIQKNYVPLSKIAASVQRAKDEEKKIRS